MTSQGEGRAATDCNAVTESPQGTRSPREVVFPGTFQRQLTLVQYFRPLPYVFQFKRIANKEILSYIH